MPKTVEFVQDVTCRFRDYVQELIMGTGNDQESLRKEIELAKRDWYYAHNYFQNVTDPDLIDHAIYMLEAAEAKYTYLLKQARETVNC